MSRLEAGQSKVEVALWLQGASKGVSRLWNQFQKSGTDTKKVGQGLQRATKSKQDRYLALSTRHHKQATVPELTCDLAAGSGRKISKLE
ncbi:hypothetical protein TNCV_3723641 [Trichonephila clavipes]|nr:hypothetical protein TNCV_3723641 [Trichonephila clavipes]